MTNSKGHHIGLGKTGGKFSFGQIGRPQHTRYFVYIRSYSDYRGEEEQEQRTQARSR